MRFGHYGCCTTSSCPCAHPREPRRGVWPSGSHVTITKEKAGHAQNILLVRVTWLTSGQKATLRRILSHFRLHMRRTYFGTGHVTYVTSGNAMVRSPANVSWAVPIYYYHSIASGEYHSVRSLTVLVLLAILLSVLRYTDYDCPFAIFKLLFFQSQTLIGPWIDYRLIDKFQISECDMNSECEFEINLLNDFLHKFIHWDLKFLKRSTIWFQSWSRKDNAWYSTT